MRLKKMAQGRSGGGYRRTGRSELNKATTREGGAARAGKRWYEVVGEDGRVGHMYNADDPGSIQWLKPKKGVEVKGGAAAEVPRGNAREASAVRGSAQSQFKQDVSRVPPRNLVELLDQLRVNGRRTRSF